jgi:hypothetical protein
MCLVIRKNTITLQLQSNQFAFLVMVQNEVVKLAQSLNIAESVIYSIIAAYNGITYNDIVNLITATDKITGVGIGRINGYKSATSNGTETSNFTINIGASYANMLSKDINIYENFDISKVDINKFHYEYCLLDNIRVENPNYDPTNKKSKKTMLVSYDNLEKFKMAIMAELPNALKELANGTTRTNDTSADVWINKALVWNGNSKKLSLRGMLIGGKEIVEKGEYDMKRTAPLTVAKNLISKQANGRAQTLRRFNIERISNNIKLAGGEVIIEQREPHEIK